MSEARGGRPRDTRLHQRILEATRELLATGSYAELSMESVALRAEVGKKTLYRRWPSKAPLIAEAVLDAYGRGGSFAVADTGDIRADLRAWLTEHAEFLAEAPNATLMRAVIAAAAASRADGDALDVQLSVPQHEGLRTRLRHAAAQGEIRGGADIDAMADALIGTLLLHALSASGNRRAATGFEGLLDALLDGVRTPPA
ncbi:TetR/AcrR family transcriptional regulator [Nocardia sp. NPDC003345]